MSLDVVTAPDVGAFSATQPRTEVTEHRARSSQIAFVVLLLVLLFGSYIRLVGLGDLDLWSDELFHVFAAESIERGDGPRLPSGELYTRGIDITRMVVLARRVIDDPEASARFPSAIFGIAGLLTFAAIAWRLVGRWPAVWATFLLAVFPLSLQEARNTRFYTLQLLHGLVAFYAGWRALRPGSIAREGGGAAPSVRERWGWIALTVLAFLSATRIQPTTVSIAAGWGVAALVFAGYDIKRWGRGALRQSVPLQLVLAGLIGVALVLAVRPGLVRALIEFALDVPLWAEGEYSPRMYYWMFAGWTPLLMPLLPLFFLASARRDLALTAYLFAWFTVPLVLHSFVFTFQAERYVLLALPALFVAVGIAATDGCAALFRVVSAEAQRVTTRMSPRLAQLAGLLAVASVVGAALITQPAVTRSIGVARGQLDVRSQTDWRRALEVLRSTPGADTLPWGSLQHLSAAFYWRRVDFTIERGMLDRPSGGPETRGPRPIVVHSEGTRDFYAGVPVLWRASAVRQYFGTGRDVIVAMDSVPYTVHAGSVVGELLKGGAKELCHGQCGSLHVYRWTLVDDTSTAGR